MSGEVRSAEADGLTRTPRGAVKIELGGLRLIPGPKGDTGEQGPRGNGIEEAVLNEDYTLTLRFEDGSSYTTGPIRGEKGVGITSVELTPGNHEATPYDTLVIGLTDGSSQTLQIYNGAAESAKKAGEYAGEAKAASEVARQYHSKLPIIQNGTWWIWNVDTQTYEDTGEAAKGDKGESFAVLGHYESLEALRAARPSPEAGEAWGVGEAAPYELYIYDSVGGDWCDYGPITAIDAGEITADEVSALWGADPEDVEGSTGTAGTGGATDHRLLTNRDAEAQHPIEAISGLEEVTDEELQEIWASSLNPLNLASTQA